MIRVSPPQHRDFGYVARDASTRLHRCHIFRCGMPARAIAHVLLETHQRQRMARQRSQGTNRSKEGSAVTEGPPATVSNGGVPHGVPPGGHPQGGHEYYVRFKCMFMGSCGVAAGQGMSVLNDAVERLRAEQEQGQCQGHEVIVDVATSNVTIADSKVPPPLPCTIMLPW